MSKSFTALAVLMAVQDGLVELDPENTNAREKLEEMRGEQDER